MSTHRLASGGLIDRAQPLSFSFDGQSVLGLCRRHARLRADREWREAGRAFVQVSSPARHSHVRLRRAECAGRAAHRRAARAEHARDDGGALRRTGRHEPEPLAVARVRRGRDQRRARALSSRGLLLQDLHVAGEILGGGVRAADPPRRGARPRGGRGGSGSLREGLRALRRAGDRRGSGRVDGGAGGRPCGGARDPRRRGFPAWRAVACGAHRDRRQAGRRMGRAGRGRARGAARCAHHAPHGSYQRVRSWPVCRDRARQRPCAAAAGARAAPAALEDRGEARGAGGRRARAHDRVRQQRSPWRDDGERGAHRHQPLRRYAGAAHRGLHQQ